jgi:hypothetical protein
MTSDQRGDSPHAKERRFDELPQRRRRQLLIIAAIRSLASVTVLLTAYFLLPFTRLSSDSSIAQFAVRNLDCHRCFERSDGGNPAC